MKVFISQPMRGLGANQVVIRKHEIMDKIKRSEPGRAFEFNQFVPANPEESHVLMLGRSIQELATCDAAYFAIGWEKARGCRIEHEICRQYGIPIIYETEDEI